MCKIMYYKNMHSSRGSQLNHRQIWIEIEIQIFSKANFMTVSFYEGKDKVCRLSG